MIPSLYSFVILMELILATHTITSLYVLVIDFMTTAHEEPGGGQDGGCVDEVTQQTLRSN